ncbi:MAG: N-acetylglucosamine-6-phosphate deacetylase [Phycisphaerae bacterium]
MLRFTGATLVLPDSLIADGVVDVGADGRIAFCGRRADAPPGDPRGQVIDATGQYLAPGFVDMHVHGAAGRDFMDGTPAAFEAVLAAHARHGTTTVAPTNTVGRHEQIIAFLECCRAAVRAGPDAARGLPRVAGAHLYGPYFAEEKVGCHPRLMRPPTRGEYMEYLAYAPDALVVATCAPELDGAADFYRDARERGVRLNAGHSNATWDEMAAAHALGVRHVDHLFCAMSNYVSVRSRFAPPYRGGMLEFVLATADMTTEVIADGRHLAPELLKFAVTMKGADRVALVTDASRATDMPPWEYLFGPIDGGEPFYHDGEVGLTPDGRSLASGARGMDHMVRHMHRAGGVDLPTAVRMASLTPATVLGIDREVGSIAAGKRADLVLLDGELAVGGVWVGGVRVGTA